MASKIRLNKKFFKDSSKVAKWLEENWSKKVADKFVKVLHDRIYRLSFTPGAGMVTKDKKVRKLTINKHNVIYYRIKGRTITIISLFNTKQNPKRSKYE